MMIKRLKSLAAAALVAVTAAAGIAATTQTAAADGFRYEFRIGDGHYGPGGHYGSRYDRGWRRDHERRGCSPFRAVEKAERLGVRRAHVARAGYRSVIVSGRHHGRPVSVAFANERSCPVIDFRR